MELASVSGFSALARRVRPASGCLLLFHRVARPDGWADLPNRDFYIDAAFLGEFLDHLGRTGWAVVTMDEALLRMRAGRDGGRFVNFSIDDTYRDTWELAVPVFRRRGLPVTLFVTTGIPDRTMVLWAAGLETVLLERDEVRLPDGSAAEARTAAEKRALFGRLAAAWEAQGPAPLYERFCALNGYVPADLHDRHAMTWEMLDELRDDPAVEIGAHTMTHPRLSALSDEGARREIAGCRRRLQERLGVPVRHFAFPYGRKGDCGAREFALAREAGYATAATTRKGLLGVGEGPGGCHALPRNTLNGAHRRLSQMQTHLSGLGGFVARVMGAT